MSRTIEIAAPSRLHAGLFAFGRPGDARNHGGLGLMVDQPGVRLIVSESTEFRVSGRHQRRVLEFAIAAARAFGLSAPPAGHFQMIAAPSQHSGLGVGTQLGLSVAAAIARISGQSNYDLSTLTKAVGRGKRSAVGALGFIEGGLIVDPGHRGDHLPDKAELRRPMPEAWRIVLVIDPNLQGLSGKPESEAFRAIPPMAPETTERLRQILFEKILPALEVDRFETFCTGLHEYGLQAGDCFASLQGGPFAGAGIARRVEAIRALGFAGCGQSSWGPTVFALARSESEALRLVEALEREPSCRSCDLLVSPPNNCGATILDSQESYS